MKTVGGAEEGKRRKGWEEVERERQSERGERENGIRINKVIAFVFEKELSGRQACK